MNIQDTIKITENGLVDHFKAAFPYDRTLEGVDDPAQFAAGRLLLLSRVAAAGDSRSNAWHSLNDAIAEMALDSGGTALYVRRERAEAPLEWRFRNHAD